MGQDFLVIDFVGATRQLDRIEISLVYDKSDKHTTLYDNYNVEMASKRIKAVRPTKFTEIYSLTKEKKKYRQLDSKTSTLQADCDKEL